MGVDDEEESLGEVDAKGSRIGLRLRIAADLFKRYDADIEKDIHLYTQHFPWYLLKMFEEYTYESYGYDGLKRLLNDFICSLKTCRNELPKELMYELKYHDFIE